MHLNTEWGVGVSFTGSPSENLVHHFTTKIIHVYHTHKRKQ